MIQVDPKIYKFLKYTAIVMVVGFVVFSLYDSFFVTRNAGDAPYHAANKLFEDGHFQRALEVYDQALEEDPNHVHAMRGRARSLLQVGRYSEALNSFNEAVALEPDFAGTYANRGILYDHMGEYELAIKDYRTALQLDPEIAEGPHWLTRFLRKQSEKPPGILERANYLISELNKPESERLLSIPEIDEQQRSYQK